MKKVYYAAEPGTGGGVTREMTFGEKLVGLTFNPSNDSKVDKAKRLFAEIADLVNNERQGRDITQLEGTLFPHTIGEILNAPTVVIFILIGR